ncbi:hypothetical protein ZEAMMB73_Zm00001d043649, partial [Zea mays]
RSSSPVLASPAIRGGHAPLGRTPSPPRRIPPLGSRATPPSTSPSPTSSPSTASASLCGLATKEASSSQCSPPQPPWVSGSQIDRERVRTVGAIEYLIDATRSGNVSRYINHRSCSPNLSTRLVLVESKDCQLAHISLFANQNIAVGEELAYDYRQKLVAGDGCFCHCGGTNCRGRVY